MSTSLLERPLTEEEQPTQLPGDGKEYELLRGELVEMQGPNREHGRIIMLLGREIGNHIVRTQAGELITGSPFLLDADNKPRPDVAFTRQARLAGSSDREPFAGAPDLAIEIVSRTDKLFDVDDKVDLYLSFGTSLVWVINPNKRLVFIYRPGVNKPTVLDVQDELDGESVLEGFKLPVKTLFEP